MSALVLAHAGHWAISLAFVGPVVATPLGLWAIVARERRAERRQETPR